MKQILALFTILFLAVAGFADSLRPGDVLKISVYRLPEFDTVVRVGQNGYIRFPQCGEMVAAGREATDVARDLEQRLEKNNIANPYVDVFVQTWEPRKVYVLGSVKSGGMTIDLSPSGTMTAMQAVSAAGGFAEEADLGKVVVLRRKKDGAVQSLPVDVSALADSSKAKELVLTPEDTVVVPKALPVSVVGQVKNPGVFYVNTLRTATCSEMISRAGGLAPDADVESVLVIHSDENGKKSSNRVAMGKVLQGEFGEDLVIHPGDTIIVSLTNLIYVVGEVKTPGPLDLRPGTVITASRAIARAGGFTQIAKKSEVLLIRNNEIKELNLSKAYDSKENLAIDVELKPGDVLCVKESIW